MLIWCAYCYILQCNSSLFHPPHSDVGNAPSPPADVHFMVSSSTDTHSQSIAAKWSVPDCRQDSSCNEPQGYIVTCCVPGSELSTTVWKSDTEKMDPIQVKITGVSPATRYVCKVAAFNMYGVGNTGSNIFVDTPESGKRNDELVCVCVCVCVCACVCCVCVCACVCVCVCMCGVCV